MTSPQFQIIEDGELPVYPLQDADRLDSHYFYPWHHRRWLNSEFFLMATHECQALYRNLIDISHEQSPVGTLPDDHEQLAKLLRVDLTHFRTLCRHDYGPLYKWERCICVREGREVIRLMHPVVLSTVQDAVARKEDNRARNEAATRSKRLQRLRAQVAGFHTDLAKNDLAIQWMDDWLQEQGCVYRDSRWLERAIGAWSDRALGRSFAPARSHS